MTPVPLKLAVISTSLTGGGAERFTSNLVSGLDPAVFDVTLCLVRADVTYPLPPHVRVVNLDKNSALHYMRAVARLRRWLAMEKPDVILSTIEFTARLTGLALLGRAGRPPWVVRLGNVPTLAGSVLTRSLDHWLFETADCAVGNSHGLAKSIRHSYPHWRQKSFALRTPTDFAAIDDLAKAELALDTRTDVPVILSVGRLDRQKRHDVLLSAFLQVRSEETAQLWICGDGPLKSKLRRWVEDNGLNDDVRFLGFQANPYALMRRADIFVLTSDYEGMPNALVEAQGLGLPAVATRCDFGPEEVVEDGRTGILVDVGDSCAIGNAILTLLRDRVLRRVMGKAAAIHARNSFRRDELIGQWSELLVRMGQQRDSMEMRP